MTHPEIKVSRVSLFLRANGTRRNAENADLFILFRVNLRSSASQINFGVNYVFQNASTPEASAITQDSSCMDLCLHRLHCMD